MEDIQKDLISQAAEGNIKAFEQIYSLTSGFVYSIAFRITNNKPDAEEVAQDVFMQIFKNLKNFQFKSSFKTWVYRITVNTAINKYKQSARERNRKLEDADPDNQQSNTGKTSEFIDKENTQNAVASLLSTLVPEQRACIVLREIEELSYKEMAEVLKVNINTVRSRLNRARQALLEKARKTYELQKN